MTVKVSKPALNLREKLSELDTPTGIAGEAMLRAETPQEQFNLIGAGRRNILINGDFQVSQRGDYTSATSASSGYYLDRWKLNRATVTGNLTHDTTERSLKLDATSAGTGRLAFFQQVEDKNYLPFKGKTMTISAWVKSSTPNANIYLYNGSGYTACSTSHSGSGQWEYLTATGVASATASSFEVSFGLISGTGGTVSIASGDYIEAKEVQLELGKVATPFEHRSYGEELALCQRYYWRSASAAYTYLGSGLITNSSLGLVPIFFPQTMRTTPTCSASGSFGLLQTNTLSASLAFTEGSQQSIRANVTVSGATAGRACLLRTENSTAAYIDADAEL